MVCGLLGIEGFDSKGHDATLRDAAILYGDTWQCSELCAELIGQSFDSVPDVVQSLLHGIIDCCGDSNFSGVVSLPVLKATSIRAYFVAVTGNPGSSVEIEKGWFEAFENLTPNIQKASPTWAAQVFTTLT